MTRSGAPFHGAHGEGRSAISPPASQAGAEPWARACPARAKRNAPIISDNAVVAVPMNRRAESTGDPLPLSRARRHNWLKSWQKSIGHADSAGASPVSLGYVRFAKIRATFPRVSE